MTFLAGLRIEGIIAPCVVDGPINGRMFLAWVTQFLVPNLRAGDIVVFDNLGSHKGRAIHRAIRHAGAHRLLLPPYSPDLNPIELAFAKLKTLLRKPTSDPQTPSASALALYSICSAPTNAQASFVMPDMGQLKPIML